jgi:hypothetical protein
MKKRKVGKKMKNCKKRRRRKSEKKERGMHCGLLL